MSFRSSPLGAPLDGSEGDFVEEREELRSGGESGEVIPTDIARVSGSVLTLRADSLIGPLEPLRLYWRRGRGVRGEGAVYRG